MALRRATKIQNRWINCGHPTDSTYVWLQLYQSSQFRQLEQYDSARTLIDQAIHLGQRGSQSHQLLAQAFCLSGYLYLLKGQTGQARKAFEQSIRQAANWPRGKPWGIQAQVNLAYLYSSEGDYEQTITHAEEGQRWAVEMNDNESKALLLREKAYALYWLRRYDEAAPVAEQAIKHAALAPKAALDPYYLLLGDVESKRNNVTVAVKAYQQASLLAQKSGDSALQATVLTNLGFLYYQQKKYRHAIIYNEQALILQKKVFSRARIFDNLAACFWKISQFDKALASYQKGLVTLPIGFFQTALNQNPSAESVRLAFRKEVLLTLIQDKADTWLDYAKATNNPQRFRNALETYQVADQMIDYMRWEHVGQLSKLFWRQKTRGMYERAIETCHRLGDTEQAFRFMEKSRAVMLADKLAELGARQQLTTKQMDEEQHLRQVTDKQQTKLTGLSPGKTLDSLRIVLTAQQDKLDAFRKKLEVSNPAYYRYKYDTTSIRLRDLQAYLRPRKAQFVSYFVGDSALYVLGVSGGRDTLIRQSVGTYNQTVRAFVPLLTTPDAMSQKADVVRFRVLGKQLYDQLLAPLALPDGPIIVSSDGSFIPFETLSRSATQPDYLVKSYAFSYVYSANLLLKKASAPIQTAGFVTGDFLGVAPVSFAPVLGQATLSGSDDALKLIADRFDSPTLLTHGAATRRTFQSDVSAYRVIHLFTHATADSTGQEPTLYFADSVLRLSDLGDGGLPHAQLVVLAACKTGIGANQRGEGVFSLARGFAALGVPSILTTLWSVENKATYSITNLFYRYLDAGLPKDVALQRAKLDWLSTAEGADQLPNSWAGLILIGDTQPLSRPIQWPWAVGGMVVLLGAGAWWWRRRYQSKPAVISSLRPV